MATSASRRAADIRTGFTVEIILGEKFVDIVEAQPEPLAYHLTQSGLQAPAIGTVGQRQAIIRFAVQPYMVLIAHLGERDRAGWKRVMPYLLRLPMSRKRQLQVAVGDAVDFFARLRRAGDQNSVRTGTARLLVGDGLKKRPERSSVTLWSGVLEAA